MASAASGGAGAGAGASTIDANLYSRQLAVYGEAMGKLVQMDVLIIGMRGLGVEIAKNLILAGPKSVTIYDPHPTTIGDLSSNYYLTAEHAAAGTPRGAACVASLAELNPYVSVSLLPTKPGVQALATEVLRRFHVVVATDVPRGELLRINKACRTASPAVGFIAADVRGAAGAAFVDYGDAFTVRDPNGEAVKSYVVSSVTKGSQATVYVVEGKRIDLTEGDHVVFREVGGLEGLNDGKPRKVVKVSAKDRYVVIEEDTAAMAGEHTMGGLMEQVKVPFTVSFASLEERLVTPVAADEPMGLINADMSKMNWETMVSRAQQLHVAFAGLEAFRERHGGSLPAPRNAEHAAEVVALAKEWSAANAAKGEGALNVGAVDEEIARLVGLLASVELPALCAFYGGVVAQEVVKFTGKFSPLRQWLYYDAFDCLPTGHEALPAAEFAPSGSRYDGLIALFGRTFHARVMDQRVFVVGAGALGCEMLKNYALMGVGCGPDGRIVVTDMDRIEVSNLNRQFLFRGKDVGAPKSVTAAAAAQAMNGDLKVSALETPVGEDTEGTFDDAFWGGVDVVTNALDNLKARSYVDTRCIFYGKPLLESGTLGTKANTQVIKPRETECYTDSVDPPEESIPMCTLRNFPHAIEHCIEWARDLFAGSFTNTVQEAAAFAAGPSAWLAKAAEEGNMAARRAKLEGVRSVVKAAQAATWHSCVAAALHLFHTHFYTNIKQLLHNFPADYKDKDTGVPFWAPPKRVPTAIRFDVNDENHFAFVVHGAALVASNYGVAPPAGFDTHGVMDAVVASVPLPEFVPKSGVRIKAGEGDATEEGSEDDGEAVAALTAELTALAGSGDVAGGAGAAGTGVSGLRLNAEAFEKDDDSNHHIDFITAASNLRAFNYSIRPTTRFDVKLIAGKIIPAIATTTCAVTGLVCIEFYKLVAGNTLIKDAAGAITGSTLRNTFINLAINTYQSSEPAGPRRTKSVAMDPVLMAPVKAIPEGFTRWDRIVIQGHPDLTCHGLHEWLKANHSGVGVSMVSCGKFILYNPLLYRSHAARKDRSIRAVIEEVTGAPITKDYIILDVSGEDDEGDVVIPPVQLFFK